MNITDTEIESTILGYPLFSKVEEKKNFFIVLGMLSARLISLAKAAELLSISREDFLFLMDKIGFNYSFFTPMDVELELKAIKELAGQ